jgi:hypothetical protein
MRRASELWAEVRRSGQPTADPKALDGDVILAAQAILSKLIAPKSSLQPPTSHTFLDLRLLSIGDRFHNDRPSPPLSSLQRADRPYRQLLQIQLK